jgi:hypothetical protein
MLRGLGSPMSMCRCSSLSDLGTGGCVEYDAHAEVDFQEIVDGDGGSRVRPWAPARRGTFPSNSLLAGVFFDFQFLHFLDRDFGIGSGKHR